MPTESKTDPDSRPHILVVDDDDLILHLLRQALKSMGECVVRTQDTGENALEALGDFAADLVIVDRKLPGMSGDEFVAHFRKQPRFRSVPVIILSGEIGNLPVDEFCWFQPKPIKVTKLIEIVREKLGQAPKGESRS